MQNRLTVTELYNIQQPISIVQNLQITNLFFTDHFIFLINKTQPNVMKRISFKNFQVVQQIKLPKSLAEGNIKALTQIKNIIILVLEKSNDLFYINAQRQTMKINSHLQPINQVISYRDGIATCSDDFTIRIWNLSDDNIIQSKIKHAYFGHTGKVKCLQTYQNILISGSDDLNVIFWKNNEIHCTYKSSSSIKNLLKCSQSNQFLVFSTNGQITVLNLSSIVKNKKPQTIRVIKYISEQISEIKSYFNNCFEIDDSFMVFNDGNNLVFVQINLGEIIIKKSLSNVNNQIINMKLIGRMLLYGKKNHNLQLLKF